MQIAAGKKPKLSLDDYAAFFDDVNRNRMVIEQLNQVELNLSPFLLISDHLLSSLRLLQISVIHGFSRHHKCVKANMLKAVGSLDLIPPKRSTISEKPNPIICGKQSKELHMSVEEVKQSLESIGWEECAVMSVLDVGSRLADQPTPSNDTCGTSSSLLLSNGSGSSKKKVKCGSENPPAAAEMKKKRQKTAGTDQMDLTAAKMKVTSRKPLAVYDVKLNGGATELEKAMLLQFPVAEKPGSQLML